MNKFFLISGIFSLIFLIYIWAFYLPVYEYTDIYQGIRVLVIVASIALVTNVILTIYLAFKTSQK